MIFGVAVANATMRPGVGTTPYPPGGLVPHARGQLGEDEAAVHASQVEHGPLGQVGVQLDGDPRAPVGAAAGKRANGLRSANA